MNIPALSRAEVFRTMLTSADGLSQAEAEKRQQEYGPNEVTERRRVPLYRHFLAQFTHFLAVLLWLAAALCFLSDYLRPGEGLLSLGVAIVAVIFINAIFTFIQEYRAEKAIEALKALLPFQVKVLREGRELQMPARDRGPRRPVSPGGRRQSPRGRPPGGSKSAVGQQCPPHRGIRPENPDRRTLYRRLSGQSRTWCLPAP